MWKRNAHAQAQIGEETIQKDKYGPNLAHCFDGVVSAASTHELIILSSYPKKKINSRPWQAPWREIHGGGMRPGCL